MKSNPLTLLPLAMTLAFAPPLLADDNDLLKPALLRPDEGPAIVPALRFAFSDTWEFNATEDDSRSAYVRAEAKSTFSTRQESHDEQTLLDTGLGFVFNPGSATSGLWAASTRYLELSAAYEADPTLDNQQYTGGIRFAYTPRLGNRGLPDIVPHLWLDYRRVSELGAKTTAALGVPRQDYWRFGSMAYWNFPVGKYLGGSDWLNRFTLIPGVRYYYSTDLELAGPGSDLNDAYYYELTLQYDAPDDRGLGRLFSQIEFKVVGGRLPPSTENRTTGSIAFTVK